jgi:hypothetical protein
MAVQYIVIKLATDTIDSFILLLAQIAVITGGFSAGASIFLLIDYFKRRGWIYKRYQKREREKEREKDNPASPSS